MVRRSNTSKKATSQANTQAEVHNAAVSTSNNNSGAASNVSNQAQIGQVHTKYYLSPFNL